MLDKGLIHRKKVFVMMGVVKVLKSTGSFAISTSFDSVS